ncbi:hypothetical protein LVDJXP189_880002 [Flavobacterium psychrophilum]|nr:hypothetical protein FPSM_01887 [Flavobacterium psychrophilum]SNB44216.1 hypothetical protein LVDJXP189_880002 [Flavobacterium psychrophilum]
MPYTNSNFYYPIKKVNPTNLLIKKTRQLAGFTVIAQKY